MSPDGAGRRNASALINRAWGRSFFWDGRVMTLEEQVLEPIRDPSEMDLPVAEAARRVGLTQEELSRAIASYVRSILSADSRYDRFVIGERTALSPEEQTGLQIFEARPTAPRATWDRHSRTSGCTTPASHGRTAA